MWVGRCGWVDEAVGGFGRGGIRTEGVGLFECGRGWMWTCVDVDVCGCGRGWMITQMDCHVDGWSRGWMVTWMDDHVDG